MKVLVTGSSGHLGEGLVRILRGMSHEVIALDIATSAYTSHLGSISDRDHVRRCVQGVDAILHTATLHKPHVATHSRQDFIDTNITGTLNLLEEAIAAGVKSFVFTSTTSAFGHALIPPPDAPAAWVTEEVRPVPKNIYGVTKVAAEDLCELFHRLHGLPCLILRTSRFFPEGDDDAAARAFISATTPFVPDDLAELRTDAARVVAKRVPGYEEQYARLGWVMTPGIDRVYVNERARRELGWQPQYDFQRIIRCIKAGEDFRSPLMRAVGTKGYHDRTFTVGPYPVA